jgi:hypothetical protein
MNKGGDEQSITLGGSKKFMGHLDWETHEQIPSEK